MKGGGGGRRRREKNEGRRRREKAKREEEEWIHCSGAVSWIHERLAKGTGRGSKLLLHTTLNNSCKKRMMFGLYFHPPYRMQCKCVW